MPKVFFIIAYLSPLYTNLIRLYAKGYFLFDIFLNIVSNRPNLSRETD